MIIAALKKALKKSKAEVSLMIGDEISRVYPSSKYTMLGWMLQQVKILEVRLEASLNLQRELKIEVRN